MPLSADEEKEDSLTNIEVERILTDVQNQINDIKYAHIKEEIVRDEELVSAGSIVEINNIFENSLVKKDTFEHVNNLLFNLHENVRQKKNILEIEQNIDEAETGVVDGIDEFLKIDEANKKAKENIDGLKKLEDEGVISSYAYNKMSKKISNTPEGKVIEKVGGVFDEFKKGELENAGKYLPVANSEELETDLENLNKPEEEKKEDDVLLEEEKVPEEAKKDKMSFFGKLKLKFSQAKPPVFVLKIKAKFSKIAGKIHFLKPKTKRTVVDEEENRVDDEKEELEKIIKLPDLRRRKMNLKLFAKKKVLEKLKINDQMTNARFKEHIDKEKIDENMRDEINKYFDDYGLSEYMGNVSPTEEKLDQLAKDTKSFVSRMNSY